MPTLPPFCFLCCFLQASARSPQDGEDTVSQVSCVSGLSSAATAAASARQEETKANYKEVSCRSIGNQPVVWRGREGCSFLGGARSSNRHPLSPATGLSKAVFDDSPFPLIFFSPSPFRNGGRTQPVQAAADCPFAPEHRNSGVCSCLCCRLTAGSPPRHPLCNPCPLMLPPPCQGTHSQPFHQDACVGKERGAHGAPTFVPPPFGNCLRENACK